MSLVSALAVLMPSAALADDWGESYAVDFVSPHLVGADGREYVVDALRKESSPVMLGLGFTVYQTPIFQNQQASEGVGESFTPEALATTPGAFFHTRYWNFFDARPQPVVWAASTLGLKPGINLQDAMLQISQCYADAEQKDIEEEIGDVGLHEGDWYQWEDECLQLQRELWPQFDGGEPYVSVYDVSPSLESVAVGVMSYNCQRAVELGTIQVDGVEQPALRYPGMCLENLAYTEESVPLNSDFRAEITRAKSFAPFRGGAGDPQLPSLTSAGDTSLLANSVFSNLRVWDPPEVAIQRLTITSGVTLVFAVLVGFPTQLLNSTLLGVYPVLAKRGRNASSAQKSRKLMGWRAVPVLVGAAIIGGFADPNFGFNWLSVRIVLNIIIAFLLVNVVGTYMGRRAILLRGGETAPLITARIWYLPVIAVTVMFSRFVDLEPAVVFGAVLAIDFGVRMRDLGSAGKKISARVELISASYAVTVGVVAWVLYNLLIVFSRSWMPGTQLEFFLAPVFGPGILVTGELISTICVEAVATMPILLLPLMFLPGRKVWEWNKWVWLASYAIALLVFSYILIPMPFAWEAIDGPLESWLIVLGCYAIFAVAVWFASTLILQKIARRNPIVEEVNQ